MARRPFISLDGGSPVPVKRTKMSEESEAEESEESGECAERAASLCMNKIKESLPEFLKVDQLGIEYMGTHASLFHHPVIRMLREWCHYIALRIFSKLLRQFSDLKISCIMDQLVSIPENPLIKPSPMERGSMDIYRGWLNLNATSQNIEMESGVTIEIPAGHMIIFDNRQRNKPFREYNEQGDRLNLAWYFSTFPTPMHRHIEKDLETQAPVNLLHGKAITWSHDHWEHHKEKLHTFAKTLVPECVEEVDGILRPLKHAPSLHHMDKKYKNYSNKQKAIFIPHRNACVRIPGKITVRQWVGV